MRIERLRVENFRRLRHVDLELPDGVIALVGRNGAGKSTLLEALGWCLYGQDASRTEKELIKRRGAGPSEDVRVHVAFRLGPHVYEVTRELQGRQEAHVASVRVDGKVVVAPGAASGREATAYLERLLHMDSRGFFTSLVARQRELAALTDAKPAERKRIVIGLLRLDAVDEAIAQARALRRDARQRLAGMRATLVPLAQLDAQIDAARSALVLARAGLVAAESSIAQLVDAVEDARGRRDAGRKVAEEHRLILAELAGCDEREKDLARQRTRLSQELAQVQLARTQAAAIEPRLAQIDAARELSTRLAAAAELALQLARVRDEAKKAEAEAARAHQAVQEARATVATGPTLRTLLERVLTERTTREAALPALQEKVADLQARAQGFARDINELAAKEARIRELGPQTPCPTCTRPLHEHHGALVHSYAEQLATLRGELEPARSALAAAREEEAALRKMLADLLARGQELREKLVRVEAEGQRLASETARLAEATARAARAREHERSLGEVAFDPKALESARAKVRELESLQRQHATLLGHAEREPGVAAALQELAEAERAAQARRADAARRRDLLAFDPKAHDALEIAAAGAEKRLTDARIERERLAGEVARRIDEERRALAEKERQAALAAQAAALEADARRLEHLAGDRDVGLLPEFKDDLISRVRPLLSLYAGRLFRDMTDGRYADLEVDEDYDVLVHDDGKAFSLERFSGGESDLANLCVRLAVSQVVAERAGADGFGFLALDEVFGSQDEARKANILRALQALSGRFRQILVITHVPDVNDAAEHVLRVEALDDGTSRVTLDA